MTEDRTEYKAGGPGVYRAINAVQADLAKVGIEKARRNTQQGYSFRGIDDVYGALAPLLAKHGLCILPRVTDRQVTERQTAKGGLLFYTVLTVEFDFVSTLDGSRHTVTTVGEAMDSADKSSNKAMSAAYKYAAFLSFAIPTEGDDDADATSHEVAPALDPLIIDGLRSAAMQGTEALGKVFKLHSGKVPGFGSWWAENGQGLKEAAAQADAA